MKNLILSALLRIGLKTTGPVGWLVTLVADALSKYLIVKIKELYGYIKTLSKQKKSDNDLDKIKNRIENAQTDDDRDNAFADLIRKSSDDRL